MKIIENSNPVWTQRHMDHIRKYQNKLWNKFYRKSN